MRTPILIPALLALCGIGAGAAPLSEDEVLLFFPTAAARQADGSWQLPVHAWVYEIEGGYFGTVLNAEWISRRVDSSLERVLGSSSDLDSGALLRSRARYFTPLLDNERRKDVVIDIRGVTFELEPTESNGHSYSTLRYEGSGSAGAWLEYRAPHPAGALVAGQVQLIPLSGRSVISDIDDTIKVSDVLNTPALLANTFANAYVAVDGMPEFYADALAGRFFHYVSASPWRLYPALAPFLDQFPAGAVHFRHFRVQDGSFIEFLGSSADYKTETIATIFERYPGHTFTLIGDSGEHDPEIYAEIWSRYPAQVEAIWIRNVPGSAWTASRFGRLFPDLPPDRWAFFDAPQDLPAR